MEVLLNQSIDELAAFAAKNGVLLTDRGVIERQKVLTDDVDKLRELRQKKRQEMLIAQVEKRPIQDWFIIDMASPASRPSRWYPSEN